MHEWYRHLGTHLNCKRNDGSGGRGRGRRGEVIFKCNIHHTAQYNFQGPSLRCSGGGGGLPGGGLTPSGIGRMGGLTGGGARAGGRTGAGAVGGG